MLQIAERNMNTKGLVIIVLLTVTFGAKSDINEDFQLSLKTLEWTKSMQSYSFAQNVDSKLVWAKSLGKSVNKPKKKRKLLTVSDVTEGTFNGEVDASGLPNAIGQLYFHKGFLYNNFTTIH